MATLRAVPTKTTSPVVAGDKEQRDNAFLHPRPLKRPSLLTFFALLGVLGTISFSLYHPGDNFMNWYTAAVWSVPVISTVVGFIGLTRSYKMTRQFRPRARIDDNFIVVIPTIGRLNTYPSLEHVIGSFVRELPAGFKKYRIDIVVEANCQALSSIKLLEVVHDRVKIIEVPANYKTANGTKFKGRANQYALELRTQAGENTASTWVLHMDDDTAARADTIRGVAKFISNNRNPETGLHIGQGVLTYDLNRSPNQLVWMADAIRPMDDMTRFAATTGSGTPYAGMHGELMLVRASYEREIGWDFGPDELVEDSRFATEFGVRYPGKTGWFPARCYGSSPQTVSDYIKQRTRWAEGILGLALNRSVPLKNRMLLLYGGLWWAVGLFQHAFPVVAVGVLVFHDPNMSPAYAPIAGVWTLNMAYVMWGHWEGLKINSAASGLNKPKLKHKFMILPLVPVFALWDGWSGTKGFYRYLKAKAFKTERKFEVIAKQY